MKKKLGFVMVLLAIVTLVFVSFSPVVKADEHDDLAACMAKCAPGDMACHDACMALRPRPPVGG